jgi:hypothetical protein
VGTEIPLFPMSYSSYILTYMSMIVSLRRGTASGFEKSRPSSQPAVPRPWSSRLLPDYVVWIWGDVEKIVVREIDTTSDFEHLSGEMNLP